MAETRRKFDKDFREGAVRLVRETGKPIAQVAGDLGINEGTLGNWVNADKRRRGEGDGALSESEREELARLRKENCAGARPSPGRSSPGPDGPAGAASRSGTKTRSAQIKVSTLPGEPRTPGPDRTGCRAG